MHVHWAEGLAHNSKMMHFSFTVFKQRYDSSFSSDIFASWSGLVPFMLGVGPIWAEWAARKDEV